MNTRQDGCLTEAKLFLSSSEQDNGRFHVLIIFFAFESIYAVYSLQLSLDNMAVSVAIYVIRDSAVLCRYYVPT